uniref:Uncharacterized protein n=1 Tax=Ditylenchus dipsaci TaxID=166011 RepID=A0A915DL72_9BILA
MQISRITSKPLSPAVRKVNENRTSKTMPKKAIAPEVKDFVPVSEERLRFVERKHVEAVRDHTRAQLFLMEEERKSSASSGSSTCYDSQIQSKAYSQRSDKLLKEYARRKSEIKAELEFAHQKDLENLLKHHVQETSRLHAETLLIQQQVKLFINSRKHQTATNSSTHQIIAKKPDIAKSVLFRSPIHPPVTQTATTTTTTIPPLDFSSFHQSQVSKEILSYRALSDINQQAPEADQNQVVDQLDSAKTSEGIPSIRDEFVEQEAIFHQENQASMPSTPIKVVGEKEKNTDNDQISVKPKICITHTRLNIHPESTTLKSEKEAEERSKKKSGSPIFSELNSPAGRWSPGRWDGGLASLLSTPGSSARSPPPQGLPLFEPKDESQHQPSSKSSSFQPASPAKTPRKMSSAFSSKQSSISSMVIEPLSMAESIVAEELDDRAGTPVKEAMLVQTSSGSPTPLISEVIDDSESGLNAKETEKSSVSESISVEEEIQTEKDDSSSADKSSSENKVISSGSNKNEEIGEEESIAEEICSAKQSTASTSASITTSLETSSTLNQTFSKSPHKSPKSKSTSHSLPAAPQDSDFESFSKRDSISGTDSRFRSKPLDLSNLSLNSPRDKSPRTPRSPLERFVTKLPTKTTSVPSPTSDGDSSSQGFLLEDLPNASSLGPILDISRTSLDASFRQSLGNTEALLLDNFSRRKSLEGLPHFGIQLSATKFFPAPAAIVEEELEAVVKDSTLNASRVGLEKLKDGENLKKVVDGQSNKIWEYYCRNHNVPVQPVEVDLVDGEEKYAADFRLMVVHWCWQLAHKEMELGNRKIVQSKDELQKVLEGTILPKLLVNSADLPVKGMEPKDKGIRRRAEKTSHILLDERRQMLAGTFYQNETTWLPVLTTDAEICEKLLNRETRSFL